jgi:hypothetical protein
VGYQSGFFHGNEQIVAEALGMCRHPHPSPVNMAGGIAADVMATPQGSFRFYK